MKELKIRLKFNRQIPITLLICMLGGFLAGFALVCLLLTADVTENTWVSMGSGFALFLIIAFAIGDHQGYMRDFELSLSFGKTRREFMIFYFLERLIYFSMAYVGIMLLSFLESALYCKLFPRSYSMFNTFTYLLDWCTAMECILGLVIFPMFLGALYGRFGKKISAMIYAVWVAACVMSPELVEYLEEADGQGSGTAFSWMAKIPPLCWLLLGIALVTAMVITIIRLGMKQAVR